MTSWTVMFTLCILLVFTWSQKLILRKKGDGRRTLDICHTVVQEIAGLRLSFTMFSTVIAFFYFPPTHESLHFYCTPTRIESTWLRFELMSIIRLTCYKTHGYTNIYIYLECCPTQNNNLGIYNNLKMYNHGGWFCYVMDKWTNMFFTQLLVRLGWALDAPLAVNVHATGL